EVLSHRTTATEGAVAAPALVARAGDLDLPICRAVDALLADRITLAEAIAGLLARPRRDE
ncbi:MAG TPA: glycerol-3-phosphate acyltransferase, partial [Acidisphaera sp.]|nr:glycerol-3-phosphate acyltransferase [Acidisphaera sp.]